MLYDLEMLLPAVIKSHLTALSRDLSAVKGLRVTEQHLRGLAPKLSDETARLLGSLAGMIAKDLHPLETEVKEAVELLITRQQRLQEQQREVQSLAAAIDDLADQVARATRTDKEQTEHLDHLRGRLISLLRQLNTASNNDTNVIPLATVVTADATSA